jgi:predicted metal-dependent enzyme (double-stranded beta helix superfamily)
MNPIHLDLAPLARTAKTFSREMITSGHVIDIATPLRAEIGKGRGWLRAEHRVGDPARYMRHILYVDPGDAFVITAITWLPGQQSPVHSHYVWCAYGVAEGELVEERYRAPGDTLDSIGDSTLRAGDIAELDLGSPIYHRVANRTQAPVVTLHVYGVAASALTTGINRIFGEE